MSRNETALCAKCYELINIDDVIGDFQETSPEETLGVIVCDNCGTKNSISWTPSVDFDAREADEADIKYHNEMYGEDIQ